MIFFPIRWKQSSLAQGSALSQGSTCDFSILGLLVPSPSRPLVSYISGLQFHLEEMAMVPGGSDGDGDSVDFPGPVGEFRQGPLVCAFKGMGDALAGAVMGSVFGFGSGLFKKQGFKGALREGGSSAKTFALLSGVHSIVSCYLRRIRGVEDALNAGIAGCATGLALSTPGSPQALLQSCVSFGVFSYILESLNKPRAAMAATKVYTSRPLQQENFTQSMQALVPVLPPFTLPPFAGVFAQFCQSKPNDDQSRSS